MAARLDARVWLSVWMMVGATALGACGGGGSTDAAVVPDAPVPADCAGGDASRGAMAVAMRGCAGCHGTDLGGATRGTPGQNLTSTNLGSWTDHEIATAILDGRDLTGTPLCTSMPRFRVLGMTGAQACDIVAHLRALPDVTRDVTDTCM